MHGHSWLIIGVQVVFKKDLKLIQLILYLDVRHIVISQLKEVLMERLLVKVKNGVLAILDAQQNHQDLALHTFAKTAALPQPLQVLMANLS